MPDFVDIQKSVLTFPKVLLHSHLEGSLPSKTLKLLSKRNKVEIPLQVVSENASQGSLNTNWHAFRSMFSAIIACFKTSIDFEDAVIDYANSLASEGTMYAELHFSPWKHFERGISLDQIAVGLTSGIERARHEHGVNIKMICDIVRHKHEDVFSILDWLYDLPKDTFVAIGISGGPDRLPRELFVDHCQNAKDRGYGVVVHAGELEGPESIRVAMQYLGADRICHGIKAVEDPDLLANILTSNTHLELCPTSNRIMGIDPEFSLTRGIISAGVSCSINTDDELVFCTNLTKEFCTLIDEKIIKPHDLFVLQRNAINAAFMLPVECAEILSSLEKARVSFINNLITVPT